MFLTANCIFKIMRATEYNFTVGMPDNWEILGVSAADGSPLEFSTEKKNSRSLILIVSPNGVAKDNVLTVNIYASMAPQEMGKEKWESLSFELPASICPERLSKRENSACRAGLPRAGRIGPEISGRPLDTAQTGIDNALLGYRILKEDYRASITVTRKGFQAGRRHHDRVQHK